MKTSTIVFEVVVNMEDTSLFDYIRSRYQMLEMDQEKTQEWAKVKKWNLSQN